MQLSSYIFSPLLIKKGGLLQLKFGGVGKDLLLFNWRPVFVIYIYFVVFLFPIAHTHPFIGGVYVPFGVYEICTTLKMSDHQP